MDARKWLGVRGRSARGLEGADAHQDLGDAGNVHLLPAADLPLWHGALATSGRYRSAVGWKRWLGITLEDLDGLTVAISKALKGRVLTREELLREVAGRTDRKRSLRSTDGVPS